MKEKMKAYLKSGLFPEDYEVMEEIIEDILLENPDIEEYEFTKLVKHALEELHTDTKAAHEGMMSTLKSIKRNNNINSILGEVDEDDFYDDEDDNYDNFFRDI
jgi:hypothetical protein